MKRLVLLAVLPLAVACSSVQPAVTPHTTVPPNTAEQCSNVCGEMGLVMSAVVIVANQTGCVCEPRAGGSPRAGGASASAAGTVMAMLRADAIHRAVLRQNIIVNQPVSTDPLFRPR